MTGLLVKYNMRDEIEDIGFSTSRSPWESGPIRRETDKWLRGSANFNNKDYQVMMPEGKIIVGFTTKLRMRKKSFMKPGQDGLSGMTSREKTIVALGLVVFDSGNPKCAQHPSAEDQYIFEWAFANLD